LARRAHIRDAPPKRFTPCRLLRQKATVAARGHLQALPTAPGVSTRTRRSALGPPTDPAAKVPPPHGQPEGLPGGCSRFAPASRSSWPLGGPLRQSRNGPSGSRVSAARACGSRGTPVVVSRWTSQPFATAPAFPPGRTRVRRPKWPRQSVRCSANATASLAGGACGVRTLRRDPAGPFELHPAEAFLSSCQSSWPRGATLPAANHLRHSSRASGASPSRKRPGS